MKVMVNLVMKVHKVMMKIVMTMHKVCFPDR